MALCLSHEVPQELPHPPLPLAYLRIVEAAITVAWRILREKQRPGFDLGSAVENLITHELNEVLCDEVFAEGLVEGFRRDLFDVPTRGQEVRSFDRGHLDKKPDLLIRLVDRPDVARFSQDGLFIECKPVDARHPAGSCYCDKGLTRFVNGEYAWAMQEAMMLGYAREGYTISPKLEDALRRRAGKIPTDSFPAPCPHSVAASFSEAVHVSQHGRGFRYLETGTQAPAITIRHLWLKRD